MSTVTGPGGRSSRGQGTGSGRGAAALVALLAILAPLLAACDVPGRAETSGAAGAPTTNPPGQPGQLGSKDAATDPAAASGPPTHRPGWLAAENQLAGSDGWKITARSDAGAISGYASSTSATPGTPVQLYVTTLAPTFGVEVYRMGWYGGKRGRLVWSSASIPGTRQAVPTPDRVTGMAEAHWLPSLTVPVGQDWPPGSYLIKLSSSGGDQTYVPLTVRDDAARGDLLLINAVSTWQAYNTWGGCSLYECPAPGGTGRNRAVKVSFDRPYDRSFGSGSADFLDHELPMIALVEQLGIDTRYDTSIGLHERPGSIGAARGVLSLGHDEYWSARMRQAVIDARDRGVNLAFFGANVLYRHIRFEPAADGRPDRVMVNYRGSPDPVADRADVTQQWRLQGKPEAAVVGIQYVCPGVNAGLTVAASRHWIWAGTGVADGQVLPKLLGNEVDALDLASSPDNLDVLASSPVKCSGGATGTGMTSYYSAPSGAGVFASGTIWWVCALEGEYCSTQDNIPIVRTATTTILRAFAAGPAGRDRPSGQFTPPALANRPGTTTSSTDRVDTGPTSAPTSTTRSGTGTTRSGTGTTGRPRTTTTRSAGTSSSGSSSTTTTRPTTTEPPPTDPEA